MLRYQISVNSKSTLGYFCLNYLSKFSIACLTQHELLIPPTHSLTALDLWISLRWTGNYVCVLMKIKTIMLCTYIQTSDYGAFFLTISLVQRTFTSIGFQKSKLPLEIYGSMLTFYYNNREFGFSCYFMFFCDACNYYYIIFFQFLCLYHVYIYKLLRPFNLILINRKLREEWKDNQYHVNWY